MSGYWSWAVLRYVPIQDGGDDMKTTMMVTMWFENHGQSSVQEVDSIGVDRRSTERNPRI
jgi:hypothetical protein